MGDGIDGTPLVIEFNNEIDDVRKFIENIITVKNPLRLWGAKTQLDDQYWKVKGVDLHNNDDILDDPEVKQLLLERMKEQEQQ